jgi:hypothetical protein
MKILYMVIFTALLVNCEFKGNSEECKNISQFVVTNFKKGNNVFIVPENTQYGEYEYYFAYKKYDIINYLYFYPESVDSCNIINIKKQLIKNNKPIQSIIKDMDSIVDLENSKSRKYSSGDLSLKKAFLRTYHDNILEFNGAFLTRPFLANESFSDFDNKLIDKILKIDSTFVQSSFWIVVDSMGNASKIERYVKHSNKVDYLIIESLKKSKWKPSILKKEKIPVNVRFVYSLNR